MAKPKDDDEFLDRLLSSSIEQSAGGMLKKVLMTLIRQISLSRNLTRTIQNRFLLKKKFNGWTKSQAISVLMNPTFTLQSFNSFIELYLGDDFKLECITNLGDTHGIVITSSVVANDSKSRSTLLTRLMRNIIGIFNKEIQDVDIRINTIYSYDNGDTTICGWRKNEVKTVMKKNLTMKSFINILSILTMEMSTIELIFIITHGDIKYVSSVIKRPNKGGEGLCKIVSKD